MTPQDELLGWMCIIACSLGLDLHAVQDAHQDGRHGWVIFWVLAIAAKVIYYARLSVVWSRYRR